MHVALVGRENGLQQVVGQPASLPDVKFEIDRGFRGVDIIDQVTKYCLEFIQQRQPVAGQRWIANNLAGLQVQWPEAGRNGNLFPVKQCAQGAALSL